MLDHQKIADLEQNSLSTELHFNTMPLLDIRHYDSKGINKIDDCICYNDVVEQFTIACMVFFMSPISCSLLPTTQQRNFSESRLLFQGLFKTCLFFDIFRMTG